MWGQLGIGRLGARERDQLIVITHHSNQTVPIVTFCQWFCNSAYCWYCDDDTATASVYRCRVQLSSVAAPAVRTGLCCVGPTQLQPLVSTAAAQQHQYGECGHRANCADTEYRDGDHSDGDNVDIAACVSVWDPGRGRARGRGWRNIMFQFPAPPPRYLYVRVCLDWQCPDIDVSHPDIDLLQPSILSTSSQLQSQRRPRLAGQWLQSDGIKSVTCRKAVRWYCDLSSPSLSALQFPRFHICRKSQFIWKR